MRGSPHAVIIGGGIVGSSIAYHLKAHPEFRGAVTVVERDPSYRTCSTIAATGVIRAQFSTPENIRMSLYGCEFLRNISHHLSISGERVDVGYREHGYVILADQARLERLRESHRSQVANGADVEFVPVEQFPERFPLFATTRVAGGFSSRTNDGSFDSWSLLQAFVRKAKALGVLYVRDEVVGLRRSGRTVLCATLSGGTEIAGDFFIDAAGARDAARIARMVDVPLNVEPRKRVTFHVEAAVDTRRLPMTILPNGIWMRPEGGGRSFLCGTTPPAHEDLPTTDLAIDYGVFERDIWEPLATYIPAFEAVRMTSAHAGLYDYNPLDENAIMGRIPDLDNFIVASGFSGHGVMHSPATGRAISELIVHGRYVTLDASRYTFARVLRNEPIVELNVF